jgi:hypothetical protein
VGVVRTHRDPSGPVVKELVLMVGVLPVVVSVVEARVCSVSQV